MLITNIYKHHPFSAIASIWRPKCGCQIGGSSFFFKVFVFYALCYKSTPIVRLLITCYLLSTTWSLIWLYLSYLTIYTYLHYRLSTFRWNPLGSPSPLTTTHSLLFLLIPYSFRLDTSLLYHMLILSYAYHWLIRYFYHSYAFRLDDTLSCYHMDAYLSSLVTCYLLCI